MWDIYHALLLRGKFHLLVLNQIQELIQTEKNYIENLKAIYSFNKYMEESKVKTDNDAIREGRVFTVVEFQA